MKTLPIPDFYRFLCSGIVRVACALLLIMTPLAAFAQAEVTFVNSGNFPTVADRRVYDVNGRPLVGTNYRAQLYYGPPGAAPSELVAHTAAPARFRVSTTASPGTWSGGTRTLTGFGAGSTVAMQVRVWNSDYGQTFADAITNPAPGNQYGASCPFIYISPPPCTCDYLMDNLRSFRLWTNPPPGLIAVREENGGCLQQVFLGTHNIDATSSLTAPWQAMGQQTSPFIDLLFTNLNARFYRLHDPGPVFSDNAVGFYRVGICSNFSMIANQLVPQGGTTITNLFKAAPNGSQAFKFNPATGGYVFVQFVDGAWEGDHLAMRLDPGEGVFFYTPRPYTRTFAGEILRNSAVPLIPGFSIISSALPVAGSLAELNFPAENGDQFYQYNCATRRYIFSSYFDGFWEGDLGGVPPTAAIGESFFFNNAGRLRTWTRVFAVGP